MKIFSWNAENGQNNNSIRFFGSFTDYDVYMIQNFKYSATLEEQNEGIICTIEHEGQRRQILINFASQNTIKDSICLQMGFPTTFKFKLFHNNFTFFPNRQNFKPRKYQTNLQLTSISNLAECWLNKHEAVEGSHVRVLQDMLDVKYIYYAGDERGNLILARKPFQSIERDNNLLPNIQLVTFESKLKVQLINLSFPNDEELKIKYAQNICNIKDQHVLICGALNGINLADSQQDINQSHKHIDTILERFSDCQWGCPRGMIQDCYVPTNNKLQLRDDFILASKKIKKAITDYNCIQCNTSEHNFITIEVHTGLCDDIQ